MAAVTVVELHPVTPTGYEVIDRGMATEDIGVGNQVVITSSGISKCPTSAKECHGIALKATKANMLCEYGVQGEMDGYSGLTPGDPLYPSDSVAGGIDTTATQYGTTPAVPATVRVRAIRTTRIRYNYV